MSRSPEAILSEEAGSRPGEAQRAQDGEIKIEVRNLSFYYGTTLALKNISLTLLDRSITAFIGPSGCGKSTLLRVLNRMYTLYPGQRATGEVLLDGENILAPSVDVASLRFRVGMVFQKATPFPMSVFDNRSEEHTSESSHTLESRMPSSA